MSKPVQITDNIDTPTKSLTFDGPVHVTSDVEIIRCAAIYIRHGYFNCDGTDGSLHLNVNKIVLNDPRNGDGVPSDGYHLGGVTGHIGMLIGSGLQQDLGKIGRGTHDLLIEHSIGHAVAMEAPQAGGGAAGDEHQDGWQVMSGHRITFNILDWYGGPNTNHAGLFCSINDPGGDRDTADPTLVTDVVANGGTILTKAAGIALAGCTRCGARNMHITAKYPWRVNKSTVDPIDENNTFVKIG